MIGIASGRAVAEPRHDSSVPANPDIASEQRVTCAGVAVFPIEGELECVPAPLVPNGSARPSTFDRLRISPGFERDREAVSYRALLGELVVSRDIELPGLAGVGVRMIPSRTAVAGSSIPVVLIPRFVGTSWYGAELVASF